MRLIDADELKSKHMFYHEPDNEMYVTEEGIDDMSTVDAVPVVRGKWKFVGSVFPMYECDQCRAISLGGNFCPNCGADMMEES